MSRLRRFLGDLRWAWRKLSGFMPVPRPKIREGLTPASMYQ